MAIDKRRVQLLEVIHAFAVAAPNKTSDVAILMVVHVCGRSQNTCSGSCRFPMTDAARTVKMDRIQAFLAISFISVVLILRWFYALLRNRNRFMMQVGVENALGATIRSCLGSFAALSGVMHAFSMSKKACTYASTMG